MTEIKTVTFNDLSYDELINIAGPNESNLQFLGGLIGKNISFRDNSFFVIDGNEEERELLREIIGSVKDIARVGKTVTKQDISYAYRMITNHERIDFNELDKVSVGRTLTGKQIKAKTKGQIEFVKAMEKKDIVFAVGPAGTGKTYLAVIYAVSAMKKGDVKRIVLTRPAVEAGENLGFLPGDLKEKVDPYLTPLYDALHVMLGVETTNRLIERGTIEIAPLAYMRGRTLDDSFVILDEAQNTTTSQMKMFLTRLGYNSHMVITGDVTQIDLNGKQESGLVQAIRILENVDDISIINLNSDDVVRHPLVQKIIECYENVGKPHKK